MITNLENSISKDKNLLLVLLEETKIDSELKYLINNFCGRVTNSISEVRAAKSERIYVCGDLSNVAIGVAPFSVIREYSSGYENQYCNNDLQIVGLGQVPIIVENAGVYFRKLFEDEGYFQLIESEHEFQELTESIKVSKSYRKGIYLTEIVKEVASDNREILHFRLLRCSSNLTGSTDNFRKTDRKIINELNDAIKYVFAKEVKLNHVLAQVYENQKSEEEKEIKAKIKAHADKTKDMPRDGLIAFCSFYDFPDLDRVKPSTTDKFDWHYKQNTVLTRLHFKLKKSIVNDDLTKEFSVTLYPNSAFIIPLSTNRLYTHEIKPSVLSVDKIPTRIGYVVRCSNVEAVYENDRTYIKENNQLLELEVMTPEMLEDLRNSYFKENTFEKVVDYGKVHFSMNSGDYKKPIY